MIQTLAASQDLAADLTEALDGLAEVLIDPDEATPTVLSGMPALIITPPTISDDTSVTYVLEWETPIIGAPVANQAEAWQSLDEILTRLDAVLEWEQIRPITWNGSQTAQAPAYLITHTRTIYKEK